MLVKTTMGVLEVLSRLLRNNLVALQLYGVLIVEKYKKQ
jgi:hypothetical protein